MSGVGFAALETDRFSWFRTPHRFAQAGRVTGLAELADYQRDGGGGFILGHGSNTLFTRREVATPVLRNMLPRRLEVLGDGRMEVSSSVPIRMVLRACMERGWGSFYYLASVPATTGGALAMNAGRGRERGEAIFDFVESVTFMEKGALHTVAAKDLRVGYRATPFTGVQGKFITSAVFRFPEAAFVGHPLQERMAWAKAHQDYDYPCGGSVFSAYSPWIMGWLMGVGKEARWSPKTVNWLQNTGGAQGEALYAMIARAQRYHRLCLRRAVVELVLVP